MQSTFNLINPLYGGVGRFWRELQHTVAELLDLIIHPCVDFMMGLMVQPQQGSQHPHLSLLTGDSNAAILVVLNWRTSLLDQCAIASGCEEGWNPSTPSPDPLCESTLWGRR